MLETLRSLTGSILVKILMGLLVISFAVWGVSDVFVRGSGTTAVAVGDTKVGLLDYRLAYLNQANALQSQLGQRLSREQLRAFGVEQAVLSQIVSGAILDESADRLGLGISDDKLAALIGRDPAFRDSTGRFSRQQLEFLLRQAGMREEDYIRNRRSAAVREQLVAGFTAGAKLPETFADALTAYQGERRVFEYAIIGPAHLEAQPEPDETALADFFEVNKADYMAPEYRKLEIVTLTAETIAKPENVSPDEVAAEYERLKSQFTEPEKRRVWQLNFSDQAAAEAALQRLEEGASFEELMAEAGRSEEDVDLGLLSRQQIPEKNIAEAAFALEEGQVSGVVVGAFGPVLLQVKEVQTGSVKPLAEVEDELRKRLATEKATEEIYDIHDRIEDERAGGESLRQAAANAGLTATTITVDASGKSPQGEDVDLPGRAQVLKEAFASEVGMDDPPVALGSSGFVWYDIQEVIEARQKELDEVRDEVRERWIREETRKATGELARSVADRVNAGDDLATALAASFAEGSATPELATSGELRRDQTTFDLPAEAVKGGFSVSEGTATTAPGPNETDAIVLRVKAVAEPESAEDDLQVKERLDEAFADGIVGSVISDLQRRVEVSINQQAIETAISN